MRAPNGMHVEWVEGEAVVLNTNSGELHYLNGSAALVYALIQEKGYEAAVEELNARFGTELINEELPALLKDMLERQILVDD